MGSSWKKSLKFLRDAQEDLEAAINRLEKAAKQLRELMDADPTAAENPARQKHFKIDQ